MQSEVLTVESGMTWKVNCSTNCTEPEMGGLETSLTKNLMDEQAQWKQFLVSNVSQDIDLHCYFICSGEQQLKTLNIGTSCECCNAGPCLPRAEPTSTEWLLPLATVLTASTSLVTRSRTQATGSESAHTLPWPPGGPWQPQL